MQTFFFQLFFSWKKNKFMHFERPFKMNKIVFFPEKLEQILGFPVNLGRVLLPKTVSFFIWPYYDQDTLQNFSENNSIYYQTIIFQQLSTVILVANINVSLDFLQLALFVY